MIKIFEMFSGYGGASFALKQANIPFECVGYSEIDKNAIKIYNQNHHNIHNYGDCTKINPEELPDFDIITGGFPCQAFSMAGKRLGFEDTRGTLIYDILRIAKVKKPKVMVLENVEGLTTHDNGKTFLTIKNAIKEIGYHVYYRVLNSKNFGTPQNRSRIIIIATLKEVSPFTQIFPNEHEKKTRRLKDILETEIDKKYYISAKMLAAFQKRAFQNVPQPNLVDENSDRANAITTKAGMRYQDNFVVETTKYHLTPEQIERMKNRNRYGDHIVEDVNKQDVSNTLLHIGRSDVMVINTENSPLIATDIQSEKDKTFKGNRPQSEDKDYFSTLVTSQHHNDFLEVYDPYNQKSLESNETATTLRTNFSNGNPIIMQKISDYQKLSFKTNEANTLCAGDQDRQILIESPTITTELSHQTGNTFNPEKFKQITGKYRRLTPKECFRLMGFFEDQITYHDISDSALYKLAGNGWDINLFTQIFQQLRKSDII